MVSFPVFAWRVVAAHSATYVVAGLLASTVFDYPAWWQTEYMAHYRPIDSPWVALGPSMQPLRGLVFAAVLYPFRSGFLTTPWLTGALRLWALLVGLGIVSTFGASPGSIEGLMYTRLPLPWHLFGLPEVVGQALALSLVVCAWCHRPHRAYDLVLGLLVAFAVAAGVLGVVFGPG